MTFSVLGCGRWGSFLAWYLQQNGHDPILWGRAGSPHMQQLMANRRNDYLVLDDAMRLTTDLSEALTADVLLVSIGAQQLRELCRTLASVPLKNKILVLCMKGIESDSGCRLTEVAKETLDQSNTIAIWVGPGHVEEFVKGVPDCMVLDSDTPAVRDLLVKQLSSPLIRFYYGHDLVGNEIGAAAKNVIGLAAGMLDGLGFSSLKGALMTRAPREIAALISALGGDPRSAYGLAHLGDYEATLFSAHSRNRQYGERFVRGLSMDGLAEGVQTTNAMVKMGVRCGVELPICHAVWDILHGNTDARTCLFHLFDREQKSEF